MIIMTSHRYPPNKLYSKEVANKALEEHEGNPARDGGQTYLTTKGANDLAKHIVN